MKTNRVIYNGNNNIHKHTIQTYSSCTCTQQYNLQLTELPIQNDGVQSLRYTYIISILESISQAPLCKA